MFSRPKESYQSRLVLSFAWPRSSSLYPAKRVSACGGRSGGGGGGRGEGEVGEREREREGEACLERRWAFDVFIERTGR